MHHFSTFFFTISDINAAIYKCTSDSGKLSYSDKPCKSGDNENVISMETNKSTWLEQLRSQKLPSIKIMKVTGSGNNVTIEYKFKSLNDSHRFMKNASELSSLNVSLYKMIPESGNSFGFAVIKISDKKSKLFGSLSSK
ncbi:DUF4124 domain-containing protein [Marinagarivorans algicola]|uniref:DUF4124 domain-containing protein n=1 Tax=Marinagarivorans algicola TaxID=1513270 RepID=UPI0006B8B378|nr:DUF4124 domain-containing protein [Marinagarivorans algicola]